MNVCVSYVVIDSIVKVIVYTFPVPVLILDEISYSAIGVLVGIHQSCFVGKRDVHSPRVQVSIGISTIPNNVI